MSEEEQEAKLELNRYIYGKQLNKDDIVDNLGILFNLIEKQQKEIEKYEQQIDLEFVEKNFVEKHKVVSKDKIREKIKELEGQKEKIKYDGNRCFADYEQFCNNLKFFKEQIDELLEEN